jgi:hypothetical protein
VKKSDNGKRGREMYNECEIEMVRKVSWDALWHVVYKVKNRFGKEYTTWDRVTKKKALAVASAISKRRGQ